MARAHRRGFGGRGGMMAGADAGIVEARSEAEVVEVVRAARANGRRVRVAGSGGSKSTVNAPADTAIELAHADALGTRDGTEVIVPAAMTVGRIQELLREVGLTLPTVGEWHNATLAGSLATATHGGSAHHGIMPTSVRGLRLIDGRGEAREIGPDDPELRFAAVSLGAFGVITEVTLTCTEHFHLEMETDVVPFEAYLDDPVAQESRREFHASVWMPDAGRVIRFGAERAPPDGRRSSRPTRFGKGMAMMRFLARRLGFHRAISTRLFRRTAFGDCAEILSPLHVPPRVARFRNAANAVRGRKAAELAIDAARAREALPHFLELFRAHPGALNNPIGLRMSARDALAISPCVGRDTLWLDIFHDADERFERALVEVAERFEARAHWGKALTLAPAALRSRYPEWDAFHAMRERFDPDGVFANALTDALGLTAPR
ncbi:MAG: D-arabinono-1,4-lactone oxidase [Longimicrobiales bacterium]|nr:D-arabinono-1,4-lactone oxidase [Longimicrobiales bacterium]